MKRKMLRNSRFQFFRAKTHKKETKHPSTSPQHNSKETEKSTNAPNQANVLGNRGKDSQHRYKYLVSWHNKISSRHTHRSEASMNTSKTTTNTGPTPTSKPGNTGLRDGDDIGNDLLARLQSDFKREGKLTCRSCLRSKALPCPKVAQLSNEKGLVLSRDSLVAANAKLFAKYLHDDCWSCTTTKTAEQPEIESSLWHINRLSTVFRFFQVLMLPHESPVALNGHADENNNVCNQPQQPTTPSNHGTAFDKASMATALLQRLSRSLCQLAEQHPATQHPRATQPSQEDTTNEDANDEGEDENSAAEYDPLNADISSSFDARPILYYSFCSLIRLNHYAKTSVAIVAPLWRGLGELATSAVNARNLPDELLCDALQLLSTYLRQGLDIFLVHAADFALCRTPATGLVHSKQLLVRAKLVSFFVARARIFIALLFSNDRIDLDDESNSQLQMIVTTLLALKGMNLAVRTLKSRSVEGMRQSHMQTEVVDYYSFLAHCQEVDSKISKCLIGLLFPSPDICHPVVKSVLSLTDDDTDNTTPATALVRQFSHASLSLGRVEILKLILTRATQSNTANHNEGLVDLLLQVSENLLLVALPQCLAPLSVSLLSCVGGAASSQKSSRSDGAKLTSDPIFAIGRLLEHVHDSSFMVSEPSKQTQLYHLLIRWMANAATAGKEEADLHPISREVVLSAIFLFCRSGTDARAPTSTPTPTGHSPNGKEPTGRRSRFISLLVKLLVDGRTVTELRANIAALVGRLCSCSDSVGATTQHFVEEEVSLLMEGKKKGKKRKLSQTAGRTSWKMYDFEDFQAIVTTLRLLRRPLGSHFLRGQVQSFCQNACRANGNSSGGSPSAGGGRMGSAERTTIVLALLEASIHEKAKTSTPNDFLQNFQNISGGCDVLQFQSALLHCAFELHLSSFGKTDDPPKLLAAKALYCTAVLRFCSIVAMSTSRRGSIGFVPVAELCRLLNICTGTSIFLPQIGNGNQREKVTLANMPVEKFRNFILFGAMRAMGPMGMAIPPNCPEQILKQLIGSFNGLFSCPQWPVLSIPLSTLVTLGAALHPTHQRILPLCLPESKRALFRTRVGGLKPKDGHGPHDHRETRDAGDILRLYHTVSVKMRSNISHRRGSEAKIFPIVGTLQIKPGSYFIRMPTQEDRHALVVFPPGEQSLTDIRHMYEVQDDESPPKIQSLQRATLSPDGVCHYLLHSVQ